jgi:hypothetical protein
MENIDEIAMSHFPNINRDQALQRPILYSNWMDKNYIPVDREELRHYVKARSDLNTENVCHLLTLTIKVIARIPDSSDIRMAYFSWNPLS